MTAMMNMLSVDLMLSNQHYQISVKLYLIMCIYQSNYIQIHHLQALQEYMPKLQPTRKLGWDHLQMWT
jgi:hypothetical protein